MKKKFLKYISFWKIALAIIIFLCITYSLSCYGFSKNPGKLCHTTTIIAAPVIFIMPLTNFQIPLWLILVIGVVYSCIISLIITSIIKFIRRKINKTYEN